VTHRRPTARFAVLAMSETKARPRIHRDSFLADCGLSRQTRRLPPPWIVEEESAFLSPPDTGSDLSIRRQARTKAKPKASSAVARRALAVVQIGAWPEIRPQDGRLVKHTASNEANRGMHAQKGPDN